MSSIYKYFSQDVFDFVFQDDDQIGLKCSHPKDYNDPYELFLGVDLEVGTEGLSTYKVVVGDLPQFYTTCFSISASSSPMWAHYANNHTGFVVEFDRNDLIDSIDGSSINDISYRDSPDEV
jgi:hypothetical protein